MDLEQKYSYKYVSPVDVCKNCALGRFLAIGPAQICPMTTVAAIFQSGKKISPE